jgi:hypothetical protein
MVAVKYVETLKENRMRTRREMFENPSGGIPDNGIIEVLCDIRDLLLVQLGVKDLQGCGVIEMKKKELEEKNG